MGYKGYHPTQRTTTISRAEYKSIGGAKSRPRLAKKVATLERKVNTIGKPEFKAIYTHQENLNLYNAGFGQMLLLNGCSQGDGLSSREGRQIRLRSVQIHFKHRYNTAAPAYNFTTRAILFIDREPHAAAPAIGDLLRTLEGQGYDEAPRNLDYRSRFVILKDRFLQGDIFDNNGTTFVLHDHKLVKYKKLNLITTFDNSNNADITDITKGALYLWMFNAEATNPQLGYVSAVVRFTDN